MKIGRALLSIIKLRNGFPRFGWGLNTPEDRHCGYYGFWLDNFKNWALTAHFFVRRECWSWGFGRDKYIIDQKWLGLGPICLICWGAA